MARLEDLPPPTRQRLTDLDCPKYDTSPFVTGGPLARRRVAVVTSAAIHARGERPMLPSENVFRELPTALGRGDLVMTHISVNYDRTGFQRDINVVYPIDRLRELAADGVIGSVADRHYAVMGSNDPQAWGDLADRMVARLRDDHVDAVVLSPV